MLPAQDVAVRPDSVVDGLRRAVLSRELARDTAVTEAYVARTFGVARPTARIAIDKLVADGILVRKPHHAARVRVLDRDDIIDLFVSRAAIEVAAVELLASTATVPAEATTAHCTLRERPSGGSYAEADLAFHRSLVHGTTSTRLPRLHDLLMGEIELGIAQIEAHRLRSSDEIVAEHQAILDAIAAGDVAGASALARQHVLASRDQLVAHYDSTHPTAQKVT
ncbi:GntR family transcriptional regulator [Aeromicrobium fastidiosum]|uniref:GntR family transcriptional regulator n=1 Tax=Aeromicrobium fastidiosum TaxID=52699 RepID=A0A641AR77_9ACTN|nr:GntR family transcriptional regulator [Aeromicrobium fastidiosum]KAA1380614.1 GntR family transcriptional regulator [Aeromicrobium fastidiosum]MBP2390216.1 DNA-binding GntR family transcriptional regulator [Aeromicrobium fastidiosum]